MITDNFKVQYRDMLLLRFNFTALKSLLKVTRHKLCDCLRLSTLSSLASITNLYSLLKNCSKSYSMAFKGNCSKKPSSKALLLRINKCLLG